jgi:hypothetical protein
MDSKEAPVSMRLPCPSCHQLHIDDGEYATKPHHTHACQNCGHVWRPATICTIGVRFLPGYKNEDVNVDWCGVLPYQLRVCCSVCCNSTNTPGPDYTFIDGKWYCEEHYNKPRSRG